MNLSRRRGQGGFGKNKQVGGISGSGSGQKRGKSSGYFFLLKQGEPCGDVPVLLMEKARSCVSRGFLKNRMQWDFGSKPGSHVLSFPLAQSHVTVFSTCCNALNFTSFFECILISL